MVDRAEGLFAVSLIPERIQSVVVLLDVLVEGEGQNLVEDPVRLMI